MRSTNQLMVLLLLLLLMRWLRLRFDFHSTAIRLLTKDHVTVT